MSINSEGYRERARQAAEEASNSPLPQVRARAKRAAAKWASLAEQAENAEVARMERLEREAASRTADDADIHLGIDREVQ